MNFFSFLKKKKEKVLAISYKYLTKTNKPVCNLSELTELGGRRKRDLENDAKNENICLNNSRAVSFTLQTLKSPQSDKKSPPKGG